MEVRPSYDFTNDEWHRLPEEEIIRITEEMARYKISCTSRYGFDTVSVSMSEITTENENDVNTVQSQFQILQQRILAVETEIYAGQSCRSPYYIMGGNNEQANLRSRNKCGDWSIRKLKV